tara:strand:+ start:18075 stop:18827 length:753 start_codon:yes stop_codon:yes gene_type:complete
MNDFKLKGNTEALLDAYQRDGVVRIREFFSQEIVTEIRNELERYMRDDLSSLPADAKTTEKDSKTIRNLWRLELYNKFFQELAESDEIISLISKLVNGKPILAAVETFNKPALVGSGVPYHQDNAYFCQSPPDMLTLWIAIDPVTKQNGPVYFIKESHKDGMKPTKPSGVMGNSIGLVEQPNIPKSDQFCGLLNSGDATIHHCETIHHSEPNISSNSRLGLLFVYRGEHTQTNPELKKKYTEAVSTIPPV